MQAPWEKLKYYYSKRNDSSSMSKERKGGWTVSRPALPDANLGHASPCNGQVFELGVFYEIDHEKLPPKSPIQLKAIRVVKVSEATKLEVTVSFPSMLALRNYFALSPEPGRDPELDERFVMSSNQAGRILRRPIPPSELEEQKHLESFWLSTPNLYESLPPVLSHELAMPDDGVGRGESPVGHCLLTIKLAGLVGWGIRRKVKYIGRHREMSLSSPEQEEKEEEVQADQEEEEQQEQQSSERKRKRDAAEEERKKKKKKGKKGEKKRENKKPRQDKEHKRRCEEEKQPGKGTKDRWSSERYEAAELKLLEIMKEKKAGLGKPIMRQALREEARKHIGDTGLLDHLLKHMAGKVVTNGTERFRRRHNSEGAMEYWLEAADLVEVRQKAGVVDPYWVPPPGWKPGDATSACPCGGECKPEIRQLREEISILKREMEHLTSVKDVENVVKDAQSEVDNGANTWQENYKSLMERNNKLEEEISAISNCLLDLKEEIRFLKEEKENKKMEIEVTKRDKGLQYDGDDAMKQEGNEKKGNEDTNNKNHSSTTTNDTNNNSSSNQSITAVGASKSKSTTTTNSKRLAARRSGFRICKPQGTFLWPDMWSSNSNSSSSSSAAGGERGPLVVPANTIMTTTTTMTTAALEEHLMLLGGVPTPPSASSATSAPRLLLLPSPTSPIMTRPPEVMAVPPPPPQYHPPLHLQQTGGSHNICPSVVYHHMVARVWAQTTTSPTAQAGAGGGLEGNKRSEASWDAHKGARSNITTDLALATPSTTYQ